VICKQKTIRWKFIMHLSFDKAHEMHCKSKYRGREIGWVQVTPRKRSGEFGKPKSYFMDLTKDPKTRTEHTTKTSLLTDIDNELSIVKSIKGKKK
jgi:hypothetical protein